jgi:hypothetical protein
MDIGVDSPAQAATAILGDHNSFSWRLELTTLLLRQLAAEASELGFDVTARVLSFAVKATADATTAGPHLDSELRERASRLVQLEEQCEALAPDLDAEGVDLARVAV